MNKTKCSAFWTSIEWVSKKFRGLFEKHPWIISIVITYAGFLLNERASIVSIKCGFENIKDIVALTIWAYTVLLSFLGVAWPLLIGAKDKYDFLAKASNERFGNKYLQLLWYLKTSFLTGIFAIVTNSSTFFIKDCATRIYDFSIPTYWIVAYFNVVAWYYFIRFVAVFFRMDKFIR